MHHRFSLLIPVAAAAALFSCASSQKEAAHLAEMDPMARPGLLPARTELAVKNPADSEVLEIHARDQRNGNMLPVHWRVNGIEEAGAPEAVLLLTPRAGEYTVTAMPLTRRADDQPVRMRLYGQEITSTPPTIDGQLSGDWNDPPVPRVLPNKQGLEDIPAEQASLESRVLWGTDGTLYVALTIQGASAMTAAAGSHAGVAVGRNPDSLHHFHVQPVGGGAWELRQRDGNSWAPSPAIPFAAQADGSALTAEFAVPADVLGFTAQPDMLLLWQMGLHHPKAHLYWNSRTSTGEPQPGRAIVLPDPSTLPSGPGRSQLAGGDTKLNISPAATKDPAFRTPLPVEHQENAAYLPEGLVLKAPFAGSYQIGNGYGFESQGWTHQTIGNQNSANDFFGLDFDMPVGDPILAAAPGRVVQSNRRGDSYGNYVVVDHGGGIQTIYAHLDTLQFQVDKGEPEVFVRQGDLLGTSGDTGTTWPHLHFAVHTGARASHSGANVGGKATLPEPLSGYYGLRKGHVITSDNMMRE